VIFRGALKYWSVPETTWSYQAPDKSVIGLKATHISKPHPSDILPASIFDDKLKAIIPDYGKESIASNISFLSHPSLHEDLYAWSVSIQNDVQVPPKSISIFQVTLAAAHVPGPAPILGLGVAFGYTRKLRQRIKTAN
jgi:hypothetical protein